MQKRSSFLRTKKDSIWLTVAILFIIPISIGIYFLRDYIIEPIIDQEFHQDVQQFAGVHIKRFMMWESDSLDEITIQDKGAVSFWYGIDKVPRIEHIGKYSTIYQCFYVNNAGKKAAEAFTTDLALDTDMYSRWFPFKVRSLHDLIDHYDDITRIVKTFPKAPWHYDYNAEIADEKKAYNPQYEAKTIFQDKLVLCDLYHQ